jgi:YbgC/YbaW family acyl-CoA thioester hydrolase
MALRADRLTPSNASGAQVQHIHETVVRLQHTDAAGVMFFPRIFELCHVAYEELLESIGEAIPQDMPRAAYIIPIVHTEADYRASLRIGDRVRIEAGLTKLRGRSFTVQYTLTKRDDRTLAGSVQTVHVVVDPATGKAMTMPPRLREGLEGYLIEADPAD